jgi:glycosyltransferase involved in cell wall biosynthesis
VGIPNFNYGGYIGRTIESVLDQNRADVEVHVSDNASTDNSRDVIGGYAKRGVKLSVNRSNVGFAGNLDRAVRPMTGRFCILLSSDDLMRVRALATYAKLVDLLGKDADRAVIGSAYETVDSDDAVTGAEDAARYLWTDADLDRSLSDTLRMRVMRVPAGEILRRALLKMRNPYPFLSTM